MKTAALILLAATALSLTACGFSDPYQSAPSTSTSTSARVVDNEVQPATRYQAHDRPRSQPAPTPASAIESFAELYINWSYATLEETRRQLADMSIGAAASAQRRAAVETRDDYELQNGRVENHGEVVSIGRRRGTDANDGYVVVTRETTTGRGMYDGLAPAFHVTLVSVARVPGGYAVSAWEPQV